MKDVKFLKLLEALRVVEKELFSILINCGITIPQLRLMHLIHTKGTISGLELSKILGITKTSVSIHLQELTKLGFITSTRNPKDGRSFLVSLSESGTSRLAATLDDIYQFEKSAGNKALSPLIHAIQDITKVKKGEKS